LIILSAITALYIGIWLKLLPHAFMIEGDLQENKQHNLIHCAFFSYAIHRTTVSENTKTDILKKAKSELDTAYKNLYHATRTH